jgi:hypothetical protein
LVFQMEKACHRSIAVKRPQDVGTPTQIPEEPMFFQPLLTQPRIRSASPYPH